MNKIIITHGLKIAFVGATLGLSNLAVGAMPAYSITALAIPAGYATCNATATNNFAQVVGSCTTADYSSTHAILWSAGSTTDLGTIPGQYGSSASSINDNGQVVGKSGDLPFIWSNGIMKALRLPHGLTLNCSANSINLAGQVAGACADSNNVYHALRWTNGNVTDLGTLPGGTGSLAYSINNAGQVAGIWMYISDVANQTSDHHATLWNKGTLTDLGTIGINPTPGYNSSIANAINNNGQVVGYSNATILDSTGAISAYELHPFLWQGGSMIDLGILPGGIGNSMANAINDNGLVLGMGSMTDGTQASFLYDNTNGLVALDTLLPANSGWTLYSTKDINNQGQIVASGYKTGGDPSIAYALLLTPQK
jgi:probable HAF family extracellular repeat protein